MALGAAMALMIECHERYGPAPLSPAIAVAKARAEPPAVRNQPEAAAPPTAPSVRPAREQGGARRGLHSRSDQLAVWPTRSASARSSVFMAPPRRPAARGHRRTRDALPSSMIRGSSPTATAARPAVHMVGQRAIAQHGERGPVGALQLLGHLPVRVVAELPNAHPRVAGAAPVVDETGMVEVAVVALEAFHEPEGEEDLLHAPGKGIDVAPEKAGGVLTLSLEREAGSHGPPE